MPQHQSAIKKVRRDQKRTLQNKSRLSRARTFVQKVEAALSSGRPEEGALALQRAQSELMRAARRGILHANTASRKISRLALRLASSRGESTSA